MNDKKLANKIKYDKKIRREEKTAIGISTN